MGDRRQSWVPAAGLTAFILLLIFVLPLAGLPDPGHTTAHVLLGPSGDHLLGTDQFGRDNLSRSLWALRAGVFVASLATLLSGLAGLMLGILSLWGTWIDQFVTFVINISLSIPGLLLALVLLTFFQPSLINIAVAVGISLAPVFARMARGALLTANTHAFVEASVALGASKIRIALFHVLPNVARELLSFLAVLFSWAALNIAALDFLGLAGSPSTASLGNLLVDGRTYLRVAPWIALGPGLALTLLIVTAFALSDIAEKR